MNKVHEKSGGETKHEERDKVTKIRGNSRNNIVRVTVELVANKDESTHE